MPAISSVSPTTRRRSILHDIEIIKRELPVDLLEFFYLTPLPGSEDHKKLHTAGVAMDPDLNKYDLNHVTTAHPRMSASEWEQAYEMAWHTYYTPKHFEMVLKRAAATNVSPSKTLFLMVWFKGCIEIENIHPLEGGFLRLKFRRDRRPGLPIEPAWLFYPKYWLETLRKQLGSGSPSICACGGSISGSSTIRSARNYMDLALTPVADDEIESRELFQSEAAQAYVRQEQRLDKVSHGAAA